MHVDYPDLMQGVEPDWYMAQGAVPRYCAFKPHTCNVYADYSILMEIRCQSCGKKFLIGEEYTKSDLLQILVDVKKSAELNPHQWKPSMDSIWLDLRAALYAPRVEYEDGKTTYRTRTIEDVVNHWGYGDPPNHGCVGDTMTSIPSRSVQVWDLNSGQVVEEKNGYNIITKSGVPARIPELEDIQFEIEDYFIKVWDTE